MIPWKRRPRTLVLANTGTLEDRTPHTSLYVVANTDYQVTINDVVVLVDGVDTTIALPLNHTRQGQKVVIKNIGTSNVTVTTV